jgi:hypothetical protein
MAEQRAVLLKSRELAEKLNVSTRCIDNWMRQRKIPVLRIGKRMNRFHLGDVLLALQKYEIKATSQGNTK